MMKGIDLWILSIRISLKIDPDGCNLQNAVSVCE